MLGLRQAGNNVFRQAGRQLIDREAGQHTGWDTSRQEYFQTGRQAGGGLLAVVWEVL